MLNDEGMLDVVLEVLGAGFSVRIVQAMIFRALVAIYLVPWFIPGTCVTCVPFFQTPPLKNRRPPSPVGGFAARGGRKARGGGSETLADCVQVRVMLGTDV